MSQPDPSHSNRNLLATIYDPLARGNVDTLMASLTDDIEWRVHRPSPVAGICNSKQEVLAFLPKMMAPYEGTLRVGVSGRDESSGSRATTTTPTPSSGRRGRPRRRIRGPEGCPRPERARRRRAARFEESSSAWKAVPTV